MKWLSLSLCVVVLLMGCATPPDAEYYKQAAGLLDSTTKCLGKGLMSPAMAGRGYRLVDQSMETRGGDINSLRRWVEYWEQQNYPVNAAVCNRTAANIMTLQPPEGNGRVVDTADAVPMPKTTNCFTVQGWTRCTTF